MLTKYKFQHQIYEEITLDMSIHPKTNILIYRPQLVRFLKNDRSYVDFTMQHKEQVVDEQNCAWPLSPKVHSRRVPCHRRFSFPGDLPAALN